MSLSVFPFRQCIPHFTTHVCLLCQWAHSNQLCVVHYLGRWPAALKKVPVERTPVHMDGQADGQMDKWTDSSLGALIHLGGARRVVGRGGVTASKAAPGDKYFPNPTVSGLGGGARWCACTCLHVEIGLLETYCEIAKM